MESVDLKKIRKKIQSDPEWFFYFAWGDIYIWKALQDILAAIQAGETRIAIASGHGVGKTWLMARIVVWYMTAYAPAKVITTAPTWMQVKDVLWSEIRSSIAKSQVPLGGTILDVRWKLSDDHFAMGLSTRESVEQRDFGSTKMQGFHAPRLMIVMDEAAGVPKEIWTGAESLATGQNNLIIAIGNPTVPHGPFYDCFRSPLWHKIYIDCTDHPNVTGDTLIEGCVTTEWIENKKIEWGEQSPLYQAKVHGRFPEEGEDSMFSLNDIEICKYIPAKEGPVFLGVDVARFGSDETVIYSKVGNEYILEKVMGKSSVPETIRAVEEVYKRHNKIEKICVDDTGVGGGVTDGLQESEMILCPVLGVNNAEKPRDTERFLNKKAEMFWNLSDDVKYHRVRLPQEDDKTVSQLSTVRKIITGKGLIKIMSKEEMKRKGYKSPDRADAMALADEASRAVDVEPVSSDDSVTNLTRGIMDMKF